ncbi:MAG: phage baseplate assembly protein V, partial [Pseudomonadota bacterium]
MTVEKYFGKYRGTVVNNVDPMQLGRIQVSVPDVTGLVPSTWANPCLPVAGLGMGIFAVPMPGSGVYVEFEQGDPDYPVWVGCFVGSLADKPVLANTA